MQQEYQDLLTSLSIAPKDDATRGALADYVQENSDLYAARAAFIDAMRGNDLYHDNARGITEMGNWVNFPHLSALDLRKNGLYHDNARGITEMGKWENFRHLSALDLRKNGLCSDNARGITEMGKWQNFSSLRRIDLTYNQLASPAMVAPLCEAIRAGRFPAILHVQVDAEYKETQQALDEAITFYRALPPREEVTEADVQGVQYAIAL